MPPELLCPLWQYEPAIEVDAAADPPDAMAEVLFERCRQILAATPPGHRYLGGLLCDANLRTALFAEGVRHCTLREIYREGIEPERAGVADIYSVDSTDRFVDEIVAAVAVQPGKPKSAAARFFGKGCVNSLSSVRYVATQFQKILDSGTAEEKDLVHTFVAMGLLGAYPGARTVAPVEIRVWLHRDPAAAVAKLAGEVKSKLLWLLLVEFVSAIVARWPTLSRILAAATSQERAHPFATVDNDSRLRPDLYSLVAQKFLDGAGPAPRAARYNVAPDSARCVPAVSPYEAALFQYGIKRKLSGNTIRAVGPGFAAMYRGVVEDATCPRQIERWVVERHGIPDTAAGRTLYVHAVEQRAAGLTVVPTLPVVEEIQRRAARAAGLSTAVQVCTRCNSLRDSPAGVKANKATTGTLLSIEAGTRECANCGSTAVTDVDAAGYWFLWLSRHIDRDQTVATVCGLCGCFSRAAGLIGEVPACAPCLAAERKRSRTTVPCAVCEARIFKKAPARAVLCANPRSATGTPVAKLVCRSCADLEAPTEIWDTTTLNRLCRPPKAWPTT